MTLPRDPDHALHVALTALAAGCRPPTTRRRSTRPADRRAATHDRTQSSTAGEERALPDATLLRWYAAGRLAATAR